MATNANPFVVNIVPLQGIPTGITSASDTVGQLNTLQTSVANIQSMVDYNTKTISADYITSFTQEEMIEITQNINLSSVSLYQNGSLTSFGSNGSNGYSIHSASTSVTCDSNKISFVTAGNSVLQITSTGTLQYASPSSNLSTGVNISGFLYVSQDAYVKTLFQTSDREQKTNLVRFHTCLDDILRLEPYSFSWKDSGSSDLGFIAQDVQKIWPSLTSDDKGIAYSRFVPLLLEGLRELHERVSTLEAKA